MTSPIRSVILRPKGGHGLIPCWSAGVGLIGIRYPPPITVSPILRTAEKLYFSMCEIRTVGCVRYVVLRR